MDNLRFQKTTITIGYIKVQQILIVTFEFTGAARGFMIMSCAAAVSKRLDSTGIGSDSGANSPALVKTFVVGIFHVQPRQSVLLCYVMLYGYLYSASRRRLFRGALSVTGR